LYKHFDEAFKATEKHPQKWYDNYVNIESSDLHYHITDEISDGRLVADPSN
jgi:hypothetical protein